MPARLIRTTTVHRVAVDTDLAFVGDEWPPVEIQPTEIEVHVTGGALSHVKLIGRQPGEVFETETRIDDPLGMNDPWRAVMVDALTACGELPVETDANEALYGCTFTGEGWHLPHPYQFDPAVIQRRAVGGSDHSVRCGATRTNKLRHG